MACSASRGEANEQRAKLKRDAVALHHALFDLQKKCPTREAIGQKESANAHENKLRSKRRIYRLPTPHHSPIFSRSAGTVRRASTENDKPFVNYGLGFFAAGSGFNSESAPPAVLSTWIGGLTKATE